MIMSKITSKGQIVIPSRIRKKYGISQGDLFYIIEKRKDFILRPLTKQYFQKKAGVLGRKNKLCKKLLNERKKDKAKE